jgi:hypothetical protein
MDSPSGFQRMTVISEAGLYRLIMRSRPERAYTYLTSEGLSPPSDLACCSVETSATQSAASRWPVRLSSLSQPVTTNFPR